MTHTKPQPASTRTQLLFGAFVLTVAIAFSTGSSSRIGSSEASTALLLRTSTSSVSTSTQSTSSSSRTSLLRSTRANIRSRIVRPIRRKSGTGTLRSAAGTSSSHTPIKAACGDKLVTGTELCDDGNVVAGDGCSASCLIETGYQCDSAQPSACWSRCGDGIVASNEKCDDANGVGGDGCSANCRIEFFYKCSGAPSTCTKQTVCGDGIKEGAEQCDDGNTGPGDGCSATCTVE